MISVIIPVYNAEKYIREAVKSVIINGNNDIECILIDDGSTDNSGAICDELAQESNSIKVIHKINGGVSSARNMGINVAIGEHILFLDADDKMADQWYERFKTVIQTSNFDLCIFSYIMQYQNGTLRPRIFQQRVLNDKLLIYEDALLSNKYNACWGKVFKKGIIDDYGLRFDLSLKYGEDYLFVIKYLEATGTVVFSPDPMVIKVDNPASVMNSSNIEKRLNDMESVFSYQINNLENWGLDKDCKSLCIQEFRTVTDLLRDVTANVKKADQARLFKYIIDGEYFTDIIKYIRADELSFLKRVEFHIMNIERLRIHYFRLKCSITRLKKMIK